MKHIFGWSLFVLLLLNGVNLYAQIYGQNNKCETAAPFCTGTLYSFPAGVNAGSGQPGPSYGCLATRPNPAWYFMKIANPGNIIIQMHSDPSKDIDFCCWGPFSSQFCCDSLTSSKIVSCSYSPLSYETCNIPNGLTGQYYMLIITNYSNQPCDIIFQQTGGTGTTDCSILPPPCSSNSPVCTGQTIQFNAQAITGATYHWWGPAGFTSNIQNPSIPNATTANSGEYFLRIEINGQTSSDTSSTIVHVYQPVANAGNDTTIMNGVSTHLHGHCMGGSGAYHYKWSPSSKLVNDSVQNPQTVNLYAATVFTLAVTDDSANCQATDMVTVNIAGGPLAVNAVADPSAICHGSTTHLQAIGSGGAGNYTYLWTGPDGFSSNLPDPTVAPLATSVYSVSVADGYNTTTGSVTVTIIPLPEANAGPDQSINNGIYTFLDGSVVNGNSSYYYSWSPADRLINAGVQFPQTIKLFSKTVYSLVVTDLVTNCVSTNNAQVTVDVVGGPLNVNPYALPASICLDDSAQLHASAGGGNFGSYQYTWSSVPPGFTSSEPDPFVSPSVNTTYTVSLFDQFNNVQGNTTVTIYPQPQIFLGPADTTVCIYDTVLLDAGNPGATYLWSNGATTRQIRFGTTGIGYDAQVYTVDVTNEHGCKSSATITVIFSFDACTGIGDHDFANRIRLYPNPTGGKVTIEIAGSQDHVNIDILSAAGQRLRNFTMPASENGKSSAGIDLSDLPRGVYLAAFRCDSFVHVHKLVVE